MKITFYSAKPYELLSLTQANKKTQFQCQFIAEPLSAETLLHAKGSRVISIFVNDKVDIELMKRIRALGVKTLALRCSGFDNVDIAAANQLKLSVINTKYAPESVAEHTVGLLLTLARNLHRSLPRTKQGNFSLSGLTGMSLHRKVAGVIGTGQIGQKTINILQGLGMTILASDPYPTPSLSHRNVQYVELPVLYQAADVILLHCPLLPSTDHLLNAAAFAQMKQGVIIVNTSRGKLIDARDALYALDTGKIGGLGLDVYENEQALFFEDYSNTLIPDPLFYALASRHNVVMTGHQGFLTQEVLESIASQLFANLAKLEAGQPCEAQLTAA